MRTRICGRLQQRTTLPRMKQHNLFTPFSRRTMMVVHKKTWYSTCTSSSSTLRDHPLTIEFREHLKQAKSIVVLSGAGASAESGVPTFRGGGSGGGMWRKFNAMNLATPEAFQRDPSLVWEFYHYRREIVSQCQPNPGHIAIAQLEQWCKAASNEKLTRGKEEGGGAKSFCLLTQNVDRLHQSAGSKNVVELHGSLWCVKPVWHPGFVEEPGLVWEDRSMPIVPALQGCGAIDGQSQQGCLTLEQLPHYDAKTMTTKRGCEKEKEEIKMMSDKRSSRHDNSSLLLRPAVVWFGEQLDERIVETMLNAAANADVLIVVGTSSVVYPAAGIAPMVAEHGGIVAEFNLSEEEQEDNNGGKKICSVQKRPDSSYLFLGPSGQSLPVVLSDL